jgi:ELWxxDGT repeat protein
VNRRVYFAADNGSSGIELWTSNGTAGGTRLVKDINPGPAGANPTGLVGIDGALFFAAEDVQHGFELWISDGTETGTVLALDIEPGSGWSLPMSFTRLAATEGTRGAVVFLADRSQNLGLWSVPLLESIVVPLICPGDCDGDDRVTVNELVRGVSTFLGTTTAGCTAMDRNDDGLVTVEELVSAVNSALHGCG